jgi:hypothetical protein
MATIGSFQCALASEPDEIVQWSSPGTSVDFVPGKGLVVTLPGRIENYITMTFDIGPGPELTAERARILSVLGARS